MNIAYAVAFVLAAALLWVSVSWLRNRNIKTDPIALRTRQAAKLKWKRDAEVTEDGQGAEWTKRSVRFKRRKEEAVLWSKDAKITLVRLNVPFDFDDFIELEHFISKHPMSADLDGATGELGYLREIELFFIRHGYRDDMLNIQAFDQEFLAAYGKLFKAGYAARENARVVAALILSAVQFYHKDRERTLRWLNGTIEEFESADKRPER